MERFQFLHSLTTTSNLFLFLLLFLSLFITPKGMVVSLNPLTIPYSKGFNPLFGERNLIRSADDQSVRLHLDKYTGSGFKSSDHYSHGFFSARIKLPSEYTAGVVVAFYTTNGDIFPKTHDELDFEFLGNIRGKAWRFQTNMYGNGSTSRGREERYYLWFDPSKEFHRYSILWTNKNIIFFIDDTPIREIIRNEAMGRDFPTKPMSLYATIWDASDWATCGGKCKVNYKYAPFVAEFTDLALHGCVTDPLQQVLRGDCVKNTTFDVILTPKQRADMKKFRHNHMYYSYCFDTLRYAIPLPECLMDSVEKLRFKETGRVKFKRIRQSRSKRSKSLGFGSRVNYGNMDED